MNRCAALVVSVVIFGAGCLPPLVSPAGARVACAGREDCPPDLACDTTLGRCIPASGPCTDDTGDIEALADGLPCGDTGDICVEGFCVTSVCGDGFADVARGEACDLGSANDDDEAGRCRTNCEAPRCGDGVVDIDEGCDDAENTDCQNCQLVCPAGLSDCDNEFDCECVLEPLPIDVTRVFAMAADDDALYAVVTGAGNGLALLRTSFDGTGTAILGEDLDVFGDFTLVAGHAVFNAGGTMVAIPLSGGAAKVIHEDFFFDLAPDGDAVVLFDDDTPTLRITMDGESDVIGPPIAACSSGAVIDGVPYASNDLGEVMRVERDAVVVLARQQFGVLGVELATDGRALFWLDERGDLIRLDPAGGGALRVARAPSTLAGGRPFELQVDIAGFAWREEIRPGLGLDDVVVVGVLPTGPRVRARPDSLIDTIALGPTTLCFSSFSDVYCLPR